MRILQINKFFYRRGGADHHFLDLCDLLEEKGDRVSVFSMQDRRNRPSIYEKYFVSNAEYGRFNPRSFLRPFRILYSLEAERKISALIAKEKPEIAHIHLIYHHLSPSVLVGLKKAGVPVVMTIHDWKALCPNYTLFTEGSPCERCLGGKYIQCYKHRCIKNSPSMSLFAAAEAYFHHAKKYYEKYVDLLIAPSQFVKDKFVHFGWPENKIRVLPHFLPLGFSVSTLAPSIPPKQLFVYIGRLSPEKGADKLVAWWLKNEPKIPLEVYGDGPLKGKISEMVSAASAKNILLHGQASREEIYAGIEDATAVILPSVAWETFGLTAIESWSHGLPVVASNRGAYSELVKRSRAGVLFDWEKDDLRSALNLSADPALRQNALSYMALNHAPQDYYDRLMQIYREFVRAKK